LVLRHVTTGACPARVSRRQRVVDLLPINILEQLLDAIIGAIDPKLHILRHWRISRMRKRVIKPVVLRIPFEGMRIAKEKYIGSPAGVVFISHVVGKSSARNLQILVLLRLWYDRDVGLV